jgi:FKBP-type peptidyl-prolyl cis-trans isomerase FkpA
MKKTSYLLLLIAVAVTMSCNDNMGYKKTKSGLLYKIVITGKDAVVKEGNILKIEYTQRINDSVLGTSYGRMPAYAKIKPVPDDAYNPEEVFKLLRKGDSALVVQLVDSLIKKFPAGQMPPFMKKGDKLVLGLKVVEVFTSDSLAMADSEKYRAVEEARQVEEMKKMQEQAEKDMQADLVGQIPEMERWLASKNIKAQKTGMGSYVVIKEPGTGMQADEGKYLSVKYSGKKLSDGVEFESNMDGTKPLLPVVIGRRQGPGAVIRGLDDGLRLFKKGGKGTVYIPGALAYGRNPQPGSPFKSNEALIFDVELADVSDKAPQQQMPMPH